MAEARLETDTQIDNDVPDPLLTRVVHHLQVATLTQIMSMYDDIRMLIDKRLGDGCELTPRVDHTPQSIRHVINLRPH